MWYEPKAPKEVVALFAAKKEVTKGDAKRLRPLTKFWAKKTKDTLALGIFIGGWIVLMIFLILSAI